MTFEEFKEECYIIRNNAIDAAAIRKDLRTLEDTKKDLLAPGAVDYARDGSRSKRSTDDKTIDTMDQYDHKRAYYLHKLENLPEENKAVYNLLYDAQGMKGYIIGQYFIFGDSVQHIAENSHYSTGHIWKLINAGIKEAFEKYN